MSPADRCCRRDVAAALLIAAATFLVVEAYPRILLIDDSMLLYEARRILEGDVIYRDFFTLFAPGSEWLLAGVFRLFGPTYDVTRHTMAVCHALIASGVFLLARTVGVRPAIAAAAAAVHPAVGVPMFAFATPHWFGTALLLALVACLFRLARGHRMADGILVGMVGGALLVTELPKGLVGLAGAALVLLSGGLRGKLWRGTGRQLVGVALGVLAVAGSAALVLGVTAGLRPVYEALVQVPFGNYHAVPQNRWAWPSLIPPPRTPIEPHPGVEAFNYLVAVWMPFVVAVPLICAVWGVVRRGRASPIVLVLAVAGLMAIGAVSYNPNPVHFATVLPVLLVVGAQSAEWAAAGLERWGWRRVGWPALALLALLWVDAVHLPLCVSRWYTTSFDTAFGRLDGRPGAPETQDELEMAFNGEPRVAFAYPACPYLYLTAGLRNPTPYQVLLPGLDPPDHFAESVSALQRTAAPFVLRCSAWFAMPDDPIRRYVAENYEVTARLRIGTLYRRRAPAVVSEAATR